jgi:hypothetical protein
MNRVLEMACTSSLPQPSSKRLRRNDATANTSNKKTSKASDSTKRRRQRHEDHDNDDTSNHYDHNDGDNGAIGPLLSATEAADMAARVAAARAAVTMESKTLTTTSSSKPSLITSSSSPSNGNSVMYHQHVHQHIHTIHIHHHHHYDDETSTSTRAAAKKRARSTKTPTTITSGNNDASTSSGSASKRRRATVITNDDQTKGETDSESTLHTTLYRTLHDHETKVETNSNDDIENALVPASASDQKRSADTSITQSLARSPVVTPAVIAAASVHATNSGVGVLATSSSHDRSVHVDNEHRHAFIESYLLSAINRYIPVIDDTNTASLNMVGSGDYDEQVPSLPGHLRLACEGVRNEAIARADSMTVVLCNSLLTALNARGNDDGFAVVTYTCAVVPYQ